MTTYYIAHIDGFSSPILAFDELQSWLDDLKAKNNLSGKELKIWKGENCKNNNNERTGIFSSVPFKTLTA